MGQLFAATRADDFKILQSSRVVNFTATSTVADTAFVTNCIRFEAGQDALNMAEVEFGPSVGKTWFHYEQRAADNATDSRNDGEVFIIYDASDNAIATLDLQDGNFRAQANGDTDVTGSNYTATNLAKATWDFSVELTGGNIIATLLVDDVQVSTATAANTGAKGQPAKFVWRWADAGFLAAFNDFVYISEFIIRDEDDSTVGARLREVPADADGFHSDWSGGFADLNDTDAATSILTTAVDQKQSWGIEAFTVAAGFEITAVVASFNAASTEADVGTMTPFVRISSTDYENVSDLVLNGDQATQVVWTQDPATVAAWTAAAVSGMEVGVKSAA